MSFAAATVRAGSLPGAVGRDPALEADLVPLPLSAFEIDRAPFPGEPGRPAAQLDYAAASAACAGLGKRLCHELEWEHACNEAGAAAFASAAEWVVQTSGNSELAGVRGGFEPVRCGARAFVEKTGTRAFRCCRGAEQASTYPDPPPVRDEVLTASKPLELSVEEMRKALAGIPSLAELAPAFTPFSTSDADAALRKGKRTRDSITAWAFLPSSIAWMPSFADELVVLAGRSGPKALIAVLYPLGDGTYAHAASAILNEEVTVAIARSTTAPNPRELMWTSCYGCPNEGGTIRYGDDRRVVIEFR